MNIIDYVITNDVVMLNQETYQTKFLVAKNNKAYFYNKKEGHRYLNSISEITSFKPEPHWFNIELLFRLYLISHLAPKDYNYNFMLNRKYQVQKYLESKYSHNCLKDLKANSHLSRFILCYVLNYIIENNILHTLKWDKEKSDKQKFHKYKRDGLFLIIDKGAKKWN